MKIRLTRLHHIIIDFVKTFPANDGVSQKVIVDHMVKNGENSYEVTDALGDLVNADHLELKGFLRNAVMEKSSTSYQ